MPKTPPDLKLLGLSGFTTVTSVDELEAALALFPENERIALLQEKPFVMTNKSTGAVALLRRSVTEDDSWDVEVIEP